jgi:hypothetical protein
MSPERCVDDGARSFAWKDRFAEPIVTTEQARETRRLWGWILDAAGNPTRKDIGIGHLRSTDSPGR